MRTHTNDFKNKSKSMGKEIDNIITYGQTTLHDELYSISRHYEASILKSVMKQLDIESSVDIPLGTVLNYQYGVKVGNAYEYLNYGNYVVYKSEKQEDKGTYKITCYDKMLYSMKEYETMNITYPITIRNYINAICNKLGLVFSNINDEFANYNKEIQNELYLDTDGNSLGYTFRDVLDELAEVTASIICINEDTDKLEIRYPNETNDTIDEEFLKDVNVKFGKTFGSINVIVLSRSAGTDNIYYPSILPQNPCEVKIVDNQIMNWNDRADYLPDIYNKLNGMQFSINDFSSIGVMYYDIYDKYNIQVGEQTYNCIMLNDEINITSGVEELIHTDMPEEAQTDYTKSDKTDRKINQTTLIVDKQNQQIQGIVSQIGDRSQKTTTITADIDGLNSRVEDIESLVDEINGITTIELENCIESNLLELHIYGNNTVFKQLYPRNDLYPSNDLFPSRASRIIVTDENNNSIVYELGVTEVLRQNGNVRDEYILQNGFAKIIRRINQDGTIKTNEVVEDLGEFFISLADGTNTISIQNYTAQIKAKFAIKSDYTEVFATRVEMNSSITQTAEEINLEVRKKVDENEVISKINQSAEAVTINANKIGLQANDVLNILSGNTINLTSKDLNISSNNFNVDKNGNMYCSNANINGGHIDLTSQYGNIEFNVHTPNNDYITLVGPGGVSVHDGVSEAGYLVDIGIAEGSEKFGSIRLVNSSVTEETKINAYGIMTPYIQQTSLANKKKNFEKYNNALDVIKNIDIYKYNLKTEEDGTKKHIGFVIGKDFKYSEEVTSKNNDGADIYSFVSLCCQAIKEQQEEIEKLRKEINNG